jgi:hypothetical protein
VTSVVIDDHILRDILTGQRPPDLDGVAPNGVATTGLWLFRLCSSLANPTVAGKLSVPVAALPAEDIARFRSQLTALPDEIEVLSMRQLSWSMAELQRRHRAAGRAMSAAMVEALAAAHYLDADIAVSKHDVGPTLRSAADVDGIAFLAL